MLTGDITENKTYELGGDEAFTMRDVAAALSAASGKTVVYQDMPENAYRDVLISAGLPAGLAATLAGYSADASGGALFENSGTLGRLLERPTRRLRDVVSAGLQQDAA